MRQRALTQSQFTLTDPGDPGPEALGDLVQAGRVTSASELRIQSRENFKVLGRATLWALQREESGRPFREVDD